MAKETITSGVGVLWSAIVTKLNNMFTELYQFFSSGNLNFSPVAAAGPPTVAINATAGNLTGSYEYVITFITATGETGCGTRSSFVNPVGQQVNLSAIPVSTDSRVTGRAIYRQPAAAADTVLKQLVAIISNNTATTYTDNIPDASLGVAVPRVNTTGAAVYNALTRVFVADDGLTAVGSNCAPLNTGYANTAFGVNCLNKNTVGYRNVAVGAFALYENTTGYNNCSFGVHALNDCVAGYNNVAGGYAALMHCTSFENTAIGAGAMEMCISGNANSAFGVRALTNCLVSNNSAFGADSLRDCTTGAQNVGNGSETLKFLQSGNFNTAVGFQSSINLVSQSKNTSIGFQSLFSNTLGGENVCIGNQAGYYETGSFKFYLDNDKRASEADAKIKSMMFGEFSADPVNQKLTANANFTWRPAPSVTPSNIGELTFEATSNTSVTLKLKGSDGTVRSVALTLA